MVLKYKTGQGFVISFWYIKVVLFIDIIYLKPSGKYKFVIRNLLFDKIFIIMFIMNFSKYFFEYIFKRYYSRRAAKFINYPSNTSTVFLNRLRISFAGIVSGITLIGNTISSIFSGFFNRSK